MGWYLRCHSLNVWPTKIRACATPIPSFRSLSYSLTKAAELWSPRRTSRASSSVKGGGHVLCAPGLRVVPMHCSPLPNLITTLPNAASDEVNIGHFAEMYLMALSIQRH